MSDYGCRNIRAALTLIVVLGAGACNRPEAPQPTVDFAVEVTPSPPRTGDATVTILMTGADGEPITGAAVKVEGNMNHAGMKPSFADLTASEPGKYTGTLKFTMGGDWFLLIHATLGDGARVTHRVDIAGVEAS